MQMINNNINQSNFHTIEQMHATSVNTRSNEAKFSAKLKIARQRHEQ